MTAAIAGAGFVGRQEQVGLVDRAIDLARAGAPQFLVFGGEAGVGKTRLLEHCAARYARAGGTVLRGAGVAQAAGAVPLAPVTSALRDLVHRHGADRLAALPPSAHAVLDLLPERGAEHRGRPGEQLAELLRGLGAGHPVLLVIDDLHWADPATRDLVGFLARTLRTARAVVLMANRSDALPRRHPLIGFLAELGRLPAVRRRELPRFGRAATAQLVTGLLGYPPSPHLVDQVFRRSGGNPFFVEELVRAGLPGRLPESVRELLLDRVEQLPEPARRVVRLAAAGGPSVPHRLLAAAAGMPEGALLSALRAARDARVLTTERGERYGFRHALLREVILDDLLPAERARLDRALAADVPNFRDVEHPPPRDQPHIPEVGRLVAGGRLPAAVEAARAGLDAARAGGPGTTAALTLCLAEALWAVGGWDEADAACAAALALDPPTRWSAGLHAARGRLALARGEPALAGEQLSLAETLLSLGGEAATLPVAHLRAELALSAHRVEAAGAAIAAALPLLGEGESPVAGWELVCTGARIAARARLRAAALGEGTGDRLTGALRAAATSLPADPPLLSAYAGQFAAELDGTGWDAAAAGWDAVGASHPAGYARLRAAEAALGTGDRPAARAWLRRAADAAERLDAAPLLTEIRRLARSADLALEPEPEPPAGTDPRRLGLTGREAEVLRLIVTGRSNRQIADQLFISPKTASVHASRILAKLGVANRVEATATAYRLHLFEAEPVR